MPPRTYAKALAVIWLLWVGVSEYADATPGVPDQPPRDSPCPDLSGTFREEGMSVDKGVSRKGAHLSGMIGNGKERAAKRPFTNSPPAGIPRTYYAKAVVVTHPTPLGFAMEVLDDHGVSMGVFGFGPTDGWKCSNGAFVRYLKRQVGGEGSWSDEISMGRLFRADDGYLVYSIEVWHDKRSLFTLGMPAGNPRKTIDVEDRFEPLK